MHYLPFDAWKKININQVFIIFLLLFIADNVVNHFVHLPIFVTGLIPLNLALFSFAWPAMKKHPWIIAGMGLLLLIALINGFRFGFHEKNLSDLLFLALFVFGYFSFFSFRKRLEYPYALLFIVASVALFATPQLVSLFRPGPATEEVDTFFGMGDSEGAKLAGLESIQPLSLDPDQGKEPDPDYNGFALSEKFLEHYKEFEDSKEEKNRVYHSGYFRVPHVAAYFFGFSCLFIGFAALNAKLYLVFMPAVALALLSAYTGSRAFILTCSLSIILLLFKKKALPYLALSILLIAGGLAFRHDISAFLEGTMAYQHFNLLVSLMDNPWRLSRLMIWSAWYLEISDFAWYELILGRSYHSGLMANEAFFGQPIWYHSDFLNVMYSYGAVGLAFYSAFFFKIYQDLKPMMRKNIFMFLFFWNSLLLAFVNGFYYFFTIFLFYFCFLMIAEMERGTSKRRYGRQCIK